MKYSVLIIDDDLLASKALRNSLQRIDSELELKITETSNEALSIIKKFSPGVAIVDLSLEQTKGPESGLELISEILKLDSTIRIIVLTSHEASEYGIKALHRGAGSFIEKPARSEHLYALIKDAASFSNLKRIFLEQQTSNTHLGIKTSSKKMLETLEAAQFAASNNRPILILGETGTGKGVLARQIHKASKLSGSFIRSQPNFTGGDLIASELFGHEKGAFTGANFERKGLIEEADLGTLFIDEVDELPKETQVSLLNVLQEKTFRRLGSNRERSSQFRLITASNRSKTELQSSEKIRQDFFHRIAHGIIEIPPLRERQEDIPYLSKHFVQKLADDEHLTVQGLNDQALAGLINYQWPGNIRELQAIVEGGAYRASFRNKRFVELEDLELGSELSDKELSFREQIKAYELNLVLDALKKCDNNQSRAAELLQLDRTSLRRIINKK